MDSILLLLYLTEKIINRKSPYRFDGSFNKIRSNQIHRILQYLKKNSDADQKSQNLSHSWLFYCFYYFFNRLILYLRELFGNY